MNECKNYSDLKLVNSPYSIEYCSQVANAIKISMENGLFTYYNIDLQIVNEYLLSCSNIPIWILEAACNVNLRNHQIQITYQNIWFCLHNAVVTRTQPSGRKFRSKVNFSPCYIDADEKIKELLIITLNKLGISQRRFSLLCGYKSGTIRVANNKIPITAIIKICQVVHLDMWQLLKKHKLFGKNSRIGTITIPENDQDLGIILFLIWLRTEGHLTLSNTTIEINQKDDLKSLKEIGRIISEKFNLKKNFLFSKGKRGDDRLIVSSSPLRQFVCLKYSIPIGYKTGSLDRMNSCRLSNEYYQKMMAAFIQTEGCLSHNYTRNKKKKLPKFEFVVKDAALAEDCLFTLRKLGFNPTYHNKQNVFKVGLYNSKQVIDLINLTKKHFFNKKKITHLREACTRGIGL